MRTLLTTLARLLRGGTYFLHRQVMRLAVRFDCMWWLHRFMRQVDGMAFRLFVLCQSPQDMGATWRQRLRNVFRPWGKYVPDPATKADDCPLWAEIEKL